MRMPAALCLVVCLTAAHAAMKIDGTPWTQWGGPHRNFETDARGLADSWPASGPKQLWSRDLGEGYSAILVENGVLYSMYGSVSKEHIFAADAATGKTIWEQEYPVSFRNDASDRGNGPNATPLIAGDRLFAASVTGVLKCLDKRSGKVLWSHDLWREFDGTRLMYGYSSSPIAYRDLIVVPVGGTGHALMAFKQSDGAVAWKCCTAGNAYSSPIPINVDGVDQVAIIMQASMFAVNPLNGDLQWYFPHKAGYGLNVSTLLWGSGNILFASSAYNGGGRALQISRDGTRWKAAELWSSYKMHVHHGTMVRIGDYVYGSSGDFGPAPLTAVNVKTGKVAWQDREFPKANMVYADGKLIILDEDGTLALATVSPEGIKVTAKTALPLRKNAWTAPTLVGSTLFVRDRRMMMALELGGK